MRKKITFSHYFHKVKEDGKWKDLERLKEIPPEFLKGKRDRGVKFSPRYTRS